MTLSQHRRSTAAALCGMALAAAAAASPAPVGRPALRFDLRPGEAITGRVRVENLDRRPRTLRLMAADLMTADTGGPTFPAARRTGAGAWLRLDRSIVRLPARGGRTVAFHATMPAAARTGQHFAGIVAVDTAEVAAARAPAKKARGVRVRHLTRLALPVRLTAPGRLAAHLALTRVGFSVDASGSSLRVGLRNDGNRIVRSTGIELDVTRGGRRVLRVDETLRDFLPSSAISFPVALPGRFERGTYRVSGVIRPRGGPAVRVDQDLEFGARLADRLERKTGEAPAADAGQPTWVWIALAALLTAIAGVTVAYVRLRRALARTRSPTIAPA